MSDSESDSSSSRESGRKIYMDHLLEEESYSDSDQNYKMVRCVVCNMVFYAEEDYKYIFYESYLCSQCVEVIKYSTYFG
jgi:hypothetical protein